MEHTISGMFNLIFRQKERLTAFGFGFFCLFVSAVVVVFWVFFFFPPEVIFFDAFFSVSAQV